MEVPNEVNIMGIKYQISYLEAPVDNGEAVWGYTEYEQAKIVLRSGMNAEKTMQTFLHELMHAMIHEMGDDARCNDESLVSPLSNVLFQVLKENHLDIG